MKNFLFLVLFLLLNNVFYASNIDKEKAKFVAQNFMDLKLPKRNNTICNVIEEKYKNDLTVFYTISFSEGGWVMVSADDLVIPILGYSYKGIIDKTATKPDNFNDWINNYKEQIIDAKGRKIIYSEITKKWNDLLNPKLIKNPKNLAFAYTPGTKLLYIPDRGEVNWRQSTNNSDGCIPSYNAHTPPSTDSDCNCDHKPAGCGPVAMGQIMWYWQWPKSSSYRSYDWDLMPNVLTNSSDIWEGEEIAWLLSDCGSACKMDNNIEYFCSGSWTTTNNIEDAFVDEFKYEAAEKKTKSEWNYSGAWQDLLRAEIDAGRPILYRGDKADISTSKHFFVCNGYDTPNFNSFHFNWGWGGYCNGFYTLDDLTPGEYEYNENQMAIVGISPTCNSVSLNITDVSYSNVTGIKHEVARSNIILPSENETLTVDGGKLLLTAGNSILLKSGFSVKQGSMFHADIKEISYGESGISVPTWYNVFTPNGDDINDELYYNIYNADTWELQAFDRNGYPVFQSAGIIENNSAVVWRGENTVTDTYYCIIKFRNSCGEVLTKALDILVVHGGSKEFESQIPIRNNNELLTNDENEILMGDYNFNIYPNPSKGVFNLDINNQNLNYNVIIYNLIGEKVYEKCNFTSQELKINLNSKPKGLYIIKVEIGNEIIAYKILIK